MQPLPGALPVSGPATPIANLPSGWQGECLESPRPRAYCAVWRDGPGPSRLLYMSPLQGAGYIQLILPDTPDIVLIGFVREDGKVMYGETRTVWIGNQAMEKAYLFLWNQHTLLLRLVRGTTTKDLALPVGGFNPTFKGVWPTAADFAPLPLPDTRHSQYPRPHKP